MSDEMMEVDTSPVYSSLCLKPRLFGIGETGFYGILILTIILMVMLNVYFFLFGILVLVVLRQLCKREPLTIDFLMDNLSQQDYYEG